MQYLPRKNAKAFKVLSVFYFVILLLQLSYIQLRFVAINAGNYNQVIWYILLNCVSCSQHHCVQLNGCVLSIPDKTTSMALEVTWLMKNLITHAQKQNRAVCNASKCIHQSNIEHAGAACIAVAATPSRAIHQGTTPIL